MLSKLILPCALAITAATIFTVSSCSKDDGCYDARMQRQHQNDICTADCPGVTGCDGNFYCNECEATRNGIRVVQ